MSLVLPCFNEAAHLRSSAQQISSVLERFGHRYEWVFVDDGSRDGTRELLPMLCDELPNARFFLHERNLGRGAAFKTGFAQTSGRVTGFIDVDLEIAAAHMPAVVEEVLSGRADVATGRRRYVLSQMAGLHRVVLSRGYHVLSRALLGVRVRDSETGFKFFNRATTKDVIAACESDGWFFDTEVIVRAQRAGLRIRELPVPFVRRHDKQSSVKVVRDVARYLVELHRLRGQLR